MWVLFDTELKASADRHSQILEIHIGQSSFDQKIMLFCKIGENQVLSFNDFEVSLTQKVFLQLPPFSTVDRPSQGIHKFTLSSEFGRSGTKLHA